MSSKKITFVEKFFSFIIKISNKMWHSINEIAERYSFLSEKRQDEKRFVAEDFKKFAEQNKDRYNLIYFGLTGYKVSTWYCSELIEAYIKTIK